LPRFVRGPIVVCDLTKEIGDDISSNDDLRSQRPFLDRVK